MTKRQTPRTTRCIFNQSFCIQHDFFGQITKIVPSHKEHLRSICSLSRDLENGAMVISKNFHRRLNRPDSFQASSKARHVNSLGATHSAKNSIVSDRYEDKPSLNPPKFNVHKCIVHCDSDLRRVAWAPAGGGGFSQIVSSLAAQRQCHGSTSSATISGGPISWGVFK